LNYLSRWENTSSRSSELSSLKYDISISVEEKFHTLSSKIS
jgi:hypothetical protein